MYIPDRYVITPSPVNTFLTIFYPLCNSVFRGYSAPLRRTGVELCRFLCGNEIGSLGILPRRETGWLRLKKKKKRKKGRVKTRVLYINVHCRCIFAKNEIGVLKRGPQTFYSGWLCVSLLNIGVRSWECGIRTACFFGIHLKGARSM